MPFGQLGSLGVLGLGAIGSSGPRIVLSGNTIADNAANGTTVGTASISGTVTGTAVWSLADSAGGKYAINSSTGVVTKASAITAGTDTITVAVSGLTPAVSNASFSITVTSSAGFALKFDFSAPANEAWVIAS